MDNAVSVLKKHLVPACLVLVTLASYFTYFVNYQNPQAFFWDENYHVASAQKYLNGVHFMEPHPPLGKLLIAAGEALLNQNAQDDQFITTDYGQNPPEGFSFTGYRFFPALLAWFTAPLLFLLFLKITKHPVWSMLLTTPYIFDTAQIVHGRGAMLETTMLFFALVAVLGAVHLKDHRDRRGIWWAAALFGVGFACALATKVFSLILILLLPYACWELLERWHDRKTFFGACGVFLCGVLSYAAIVSLVGSLADGNDTGLLAWLHRLLSATPLQLLIGLIAAAALVHFLWKHLPHSRAHLFLFVGASAGFFLLPYAAVWQTHFALGKTVVPELPDQGFYQASDAYKDILTAGASGNIAYFPTMLKDSLNFVSHYQRGVPRLDLCKSDENGSPWFLWPVGGRTINYRWATGGGGSYRYLTLVANPAGWLIGLLAVVLAGALVLSEFLAGGITLKNRALLLTFLALYCGFLAAVSQIDRVMYLYHYFMPLTFAWILFGVVITEVQQLGALKMTADRKTWTLLCCTALVFVGFQFYRPFAYYEPLLDTQVESRNIVKVWELRCARCSLQSPLVIRPAGT